MATLAKPNKTDESVSKGTKDLLKYLLDKDIIDSASLYRGSKEGSYDPTLKKIDVIGRNVSTRNEVAAHEGIHALKHTGEGKFSRWMSNLKKLGFYGRDIVKPKHWVEGKVGNPSLKYPRDEYSAKTLKNLLRSTEEAIPKGQSWSGIKSAKDRPKGGDHAYWDAYPEAITYGRTHPDVKTSDPSLYGMLLLDYGVPMYIVENAVKDLRLARPGKK